MRFLQIPGLIGQGLLYAALLLQGFAFVHCMFQRADAFPAAGKWTKPAWAILTGLAIVLTLLSGPLSFLALAGIIASIVYLVDVRPAVREVSGGRGGSGGRDTGRW